MALEDIEKLKEKVAKDPNSKLFVPLADEYRKMGMLDDAIAVLTSGLTNQPNYMSARVSLGKVYIEKDMIAEAKEEFEKVISAIPDNLFAHKKLAEIYRDTGEKDSAIGEYKTVLKLNPLDEDAVSNLNELQSTHERAKGVTIESAPEELPAEELIFAKPLPEAEEFKMPDVSDELPQEESFQVAVEDEFEKFRRSINEREGVTEEVAAEEAEEEVVAEEVISEEEIEEIGDIEKVEKEASAYVDIFDETKIAGQPSPFETMLKENEPIPNKPLGKEKIPAADIKEADLLISKGAYFKAMRIYKGILSIEPENKHVLQKVEELKMLIKMLGKDQEAVIDKLETFGELLKKRKDEFLSNP